MRIVTERHCPIYGHPRYLFELGSVVKGKPSFQIQLNLLLGRMCTISAKGPQQTDSQTSFVDCCCQKNKPLGNLLLGMNLLIQQGFQELHLAALGTLLEASSEVSVAPEAKLSHFLHALGSQTLDFESILGTRVWGVEWPGALTWWSIHVMGGRRRIRIRAVVVIVVFILGHCRGGRR